MCLSDVGTGKSMRAQGRFEAWLAKVLTRITPKPSTHQAESMSSVHAVTAFRPDTKIVEDVNDVRFPIDLVYTWVDGSGPQRLNLQPDSFANKEDLLPKVADSTLFQGHDELR